MRKYIDESSKNISGGWRYGFNRGEYRLSPEESNVLLNNGYLLIPHNMDKLSYYAGNKNNYGVLDPRTGRYVKRAELRNILGASENEIEKNQGASLDKNVLYSSLELENENDEVIIRNGAMWVPVPCKGNL